MPQRTWRHGLHQAVEAIQGIEISAPSETLAQMSFQRFLRHFHRFAGLTGTASEAASEFWVVYGLPVVPIPTHRRCLRQEFPDRHFATAAEKWDAVVEAVRKMHTTGRPILVGTRSIAASEDLSQRLAAIGLPCDVLNATRHREEAQIVGRAGGKDRITIATNMAGRGTDISLGRGVAELGGLHVIATERHPSRRIDRQLFGRAGRQGDPGSAQAFVSAEDELFVRSLPSPVRRAVRAVLRTKAPGAQAAAAAAVRQAQASAQRLAFKQRRGVMDADAWADDALAFAGSP
jgi:preprotein translocase subunit SecA